MTTSPNPDNQNMKAVKFLDSPKTLYLLLILFLVVFSCIFYFCDDPSDRFITNYNNSYNSLKLDSIDSATNQWTKNLIKQKLEIYFNNINELNHNLYLQILLITLTMIFIAKKTESITVPMIGFEITSKWYSIILPILLLYLFITFGLSLDNLINERIILWEMIDEIEGSLNSKEQLSYYSYKLVIENRTLVDAWFYVFNNPLSGINIISSLGYVIIILWAFLMSANHACIISLLYRWNSRWNESTPAKIFGYFLLFACITLLAIAHLGFFSNNGGKIWQLQLLAAFGTIFFTYLLIRFFKKCDTALEAIKNKTTISKRYD